MPFLATQLIIVVVVVLGYLARSDLITFDPGIGWHIKTGEYVVTNLSIPRNDPFLSVSKPWIADQWLIDAVLYLLHSLGSWSLVASLVPVTFAVISFGVLYALLRKETGNHVVAVVISALGFFVLQIQFMARPLVFSFLFFILCLSFVLSCYRENCNAITLKRGVKLAALFIFWANIHPSFVLGWLILFSALAACAVSKSETIRAENWIGFGVIAVLATLVNPFFFQLHLSIFDLGASKYFMGLHREWQPYPYAGAHGVIILGLVAASLGEIFHSRKLPSQRYLFFLFTVLGFYHLGLGSFRMISYSAIAASVPAALMLSRIDFSRLPFPEKLYSSTNNYPAIVTIAVVFPLAALLTDQLPLTGRSALPDKVRYPYQELELMNELAAKVDGQVNVLTTSDFGGFITFFSVENLYPVIDDRNTLVGEEFYKKFIKGLDEPKVILELAAETNSDFLLLDNDLASKKLIEAFKLAPICLQTTTNTLFLTSKRLNCS